MSDRVAKQGRGRKMEEEGERWRQREEEGERGRKREEGGKVNPDQW